MTFEHPSRAPSQVRRGSALPGMREGHRNQLTRKLITVTVHTGKNFATTISPWVVTMDALEPFEVPMGPRVEDEPAYIHHESNKALDMNFSIVLDSKDDKNFVIADKCNATDFYWNLAQLLTYQSLGGCNMNVGDLIATGTCSGVTDVSHTK